MKHVAVKDNVPCKMSIFWNPWIWLIFKHAKKGEELTIFQLSKERIEMVVFELFLAGGKARAEGVLYNLQVSIFAAAGNAL